MALALHGPEAAEGAGQPWTATTWTLNFAYPFRWRYNVLIAAEYFLSDRLTIY